VPRAACPRSGAATTTAGTRQSGIHDPEVGGMITLLTGAVVLAVAAALSIREE
jgi:hypothetical protein